MTRSNDDASRNLVAEAHDKGCCYVSSRRTEFQHLRRMVCAGKLISPYRGIYALPEVWQDLDPVERHLQLCRTLFAKHPQWIFCGMSAAAIYGLEVSFSDLSQVHIACTRGNTSRSSGTLRRHYLPDIDKAEHDGIAVTSILQTAFDCMRSTSFGRGLAIADSVLRNYGYTQQDLVSYIKRHPNYRGGAAALDVAAYADGESENGGESIARATMIELGFEIPRLQVWLDDPLNLGKEYRADFLWELDDGSELIGELDGKEKYTDEEMTDGKDLADVLIDERTRESRVSAYKKRRVMRFAFKDVLDKAFFEKLLDQYGVPRAF